MSKRLFYLLLALAFIAALTPLYSIGYVLFVAAFASRLHILKSFTSYFSNFVIAFLVLLASIMMAGVFTSFLNIPNLAVINLLLALGICLVLCKFGRATERKKWFDASDGVSLVVALVIPIVITGIQLTSGSLDAALYRMVDANGRDRVAHFNMVQLAAENNNYPYSTSPMEVDGEVMYTNYPQGWHLASASVVNGFLPQVFNPAKHSVGVAFAAYMVVVFAWFALAVFVLAKFAWYLSGKVQKNTLRQAIPLAITILVPILGLFAVSLSYGFDNYIGLMAFILLVVAASYELLEDKTSQDKKSIALYLSFVLPLTTAAFLVWILPIPALLLMVASVCCAGAGSISKFVRLVIRQPYMIMVMLVCLLGAVLYLFTYLHESGGSSFGVLLWTPWLKTLPSPLIVLLTAGLAVGLVVASRQKLSNLALLVLPFMAYYFALWLNAYFSGDTPGYYHAKLLGVVFVIAAPFACAALVRATAFVAQNTLVHWLYVATIVPLGMVGGLFILADQKVDLRYLHRSQNLTAHEISYVVDEWLEKDGAPTGGGDNQLIILGSKLTTERTKTMLFNRVSIESAKRFLNQAPTTSQKQAQVCSLYFNKDREGAPLKSTDHILDNLSDCLKERSEAGLATTVLSPRSEAHALATMNSYGAKIVYSK